MSRYSGDSAVTEEVASLLARKIDFRQNTQGNRRRCNIGMGETAVERSSVDQRAPYWASHNHFEPFDYPSSTLQFVRFNHGKREPKLSATLFENPYNQNLK
ncbi:hypothetical protein COOONC_01490 [Cooperia oncophora]